MIGDERNSVMEKEEQCCEGERWKKNNKNERWKENDRVGRETKQRRRQNDGTVEQRDE